MDYTPDFEMRKISDLTQDLFEHALSEERPRVVCDEATMWDVSMLAPADLRTRLSQHYHRPVSMEDLRLPLWRLLRQLNGL
jgi:hypothetical protein